MFGDPVRNEKGWECVPLTKAGTLISGGTPSKEREDFWDGDFPWVSPKDMKVSFIYDSIDHISPKVFDETNLKKIDPDNLLLVVRGMILAHSFPTAINKVSVSINQDMKALIPFSFFTILYLKSCLDSMRNQILSNITTASHGTKKLDFDMMEKILVPVPPLALQNQFAAVVEKVEALKEKYQESLRELEALYGSLSQRAFRGELGG
nr:restriction endonuclease subunit S [Leptospira levettii]